jgi:plastocyanin
VIAMRRYRFVGLVLAACAVLSLTACSSSKAKVARDAPPTDARGRANYLVVARGNQFTPVDVIVDAGTTVTWRNDDAVAHDVKKSADALDFGGPFGVDASKFGPGQSYSFKFTKTGTFFYTCTIHTLMSGKVEVVAPTTPTTVTGGPISPGAPTPNTTG